MREHRGLIAVAFFSILGFAVFGIVSANYPLCTKTKGPSVALFPPSRLAVSFASPVGEIQASTPLSVAFNSPMAPVEKVGVESPTGPIRLSPPVEGVFCWVGQSTLSFQPKAELPLATSFTATIPAGVQSLAGDRLSSDYVWTFSTPGLAVVRHRAEGEYNGFVSTRPRLVLEFNQPVELKEVARCSALVKVGTTEEVKLHVAPPDKGMAEEWPEGDRTVVLTPATELAPGGRWEWALLADLTGKSGPRPLGRRWTYSCAVCPNFALKGIEGFAESSGVTGIRIQFTNPVNSKSISGKSMPFSISPPVKTQSAYQDGEGLVVLGGFEAEHEYDVTLAASLDDVFGNRLGREIRQKVKIPDYDPGITLMGDRGYVERVGPREFAMVVVNLPVIGVELFKIEEDDVVPYLKEERKEGGKAWPEAHSRVGVYHRMSGSTKTEKFVHVNVPLTWALTENEGGFVFLRAKARRQQVPEGMKEEDAFICEEAVLQVTDIGITCKASPENTLIWTTSLHNSEPMAGVLLALRDADNKVIWNGVTDEQGLAVGPGVDTSYDAKPVFLIAKKDQDMAYLALDREQVGLWEFNVNRDWDPTPQRTLAHIFTERGLYKGGETVHIKGIVRVDTAKGIVPPEKKSIQVTVNDPRGRKLLSRALTLSDLSTFHLDVPLGRNATLGQYWIGVRLPDHPESDSPSGGFQVAAFRPAEFEVEVTPERKEYTCGEELQARAAARYLFGAPMKDGEISWNAYWENTWFTPVGCEEFRFGDTAGYYESQPAVENEAESGEAALDENGGAVIGFPLDPKGRIAGALRCNLTVTASDASNQSVSGNASVTVHPADFYLGVKKHSYIFTANKPVEFSFIGVKPGGEKVGGFPMKVRVVRRQWHTVRKKSVWSDYHYECEAVDDTIASTTLQMTEQGAVWTFSPPSSGSFYLEVSAMDAKERIARTVTCFYATGSEYAAWYRDDKNTVDLVANRDRYGVGETAQVLIKSPYERAKGILTIERQGIMERRVLDLTSTSPTIDIPIKRDYMPNVYVSVVLIQGRTSEKFSEVGADLGKPTYRAGYINLPVADDAARLAVKVAPDRPTAEPGEKVTVSIQVADHSGKGRKAEVAVIAADEGVLKLIGYQTPDPIAAIYASRSLAVVTSETRRSVIGRTRFDWLGRKGAAPGDKGLGKAVISGVDLFRKKFFYTAYYNPDLLTDENGRASVTFDLPDNLTRFRLMAVAVSAENMFGSGESRVEVKKPILIRPALPRFANAGDQFVARALVHNDTDTIQKVTTGFEAEGPVEVAAQPPKEMVLAIGESLAIEAPVQITDPGQATFRFRAEAGPYRDGVEVAIPVNYPTSYLTTFKEGSTDAVATEPIRPPEECRGDVGEVEVTVSASRLYNLGEGISYLLQYPYGCIEQTSSCTLVLAALKELAPAIASSGIRVEDIRERADRGIARILSMQTYEGSFVYWPGSTDVHPWASAYATCTLLACKRAGLDVPQDQLDAALNYLAAFLRSSDEHARLTDNATRCMMVYVLACAGKPEAAYHEVLSRSAATLPVFAKAFLAMAIHRTNPGDPLLPPLVKAITDYADGKAGPGTKDREEELATIMDSDVRTRAIVLSAFLQMDPKSDRIPRMVRALMQNRTMGRWMSTQENAFCLLALGQYAAGGETVEPSFAASVRIGKDLVATKSFGSRVAPVMSAVIPMAELAAKRLPLTIRKEGQGTLFYTIKTHCLPARTERKMVDRGIQIVRRYEPYEGPDGKASQKFKAGDLIRVHLTISTPAHRHYVAVEDLLPAGLEAVNTSFLTNDTQMLATLREDGSSYFNHTEMRDDRVLLFADWLPPGSHEHVYIARATTPGTFVLPGARAEEMYTPTVGGESESSQIVVGTKKE